MWLERLNDTLIINDEKQRKKITELRVKRLIITSPSTWQERGRRYEEAAEKEEEEETRRRKKMRGV